MEGVADFFPLRVDLSISASRGAHTRAPTRAAPPSPRWRATDAAPVHKARPRPAVTVAHPTRKCSCPMHRCRQILPHTAASRRSARRTCSCQHKRQPRTRHRAAATADKPSRVLPGLLMTLQLMGRDALRFGAMPKTERGAGPGHPDGYGPAPKEVAQRATSSSNTRAVYLNPRHHVDAVIASRIGDATACPQEQSSSCSHVCASPCGGAMVTGQGRR